MGYLISRTTGKGNISIPDKTRTSCCSSVVTITTEKTEKNLIITHLSVHLENSERVFFSENNLHQQLFSPLKMKLTAFFFDCMAIFNNYPLKYITNYYFNHYFG
jgi:hypothetical protein